MVLHGVADNIGHLDETAIILLVESPKDAALHRLEAIGQVRDGAVTDDVRGVVEEAAIDAAVEGQLDLARLEGVMGHDRDNCVFGEDVALPVAVLAGFGLRRPGLVVFGKRGGIDDSRRINRKLLNGQFRLIGSALAFRCHCSKHTMVLRLGSREK